MKPEPKWMRGIEDLKLVSSFKGDMIQCPRCKKKWFDSWFEVTWPDSTTEKICQDCFEKKVMRRR